MARPEVTGPKTRLNHGSPAPTPIAAFSIHEFCFAHRISVDHYFKLQRLGLGPDIMKVGTRTLISVEAAARWREQREIAARRIQQSQRRERRGRLSSREFARFVAGLANLRNFNPARPAG